MEYTDLIGFIYHTVGIKADYLMQADVQDANNLL